MRIEEIRFTFLLRHSKSVCCSSPRWRSNPRGFSVFSHRVFSRTTVKGSDVEDNMRRFVFWRTTSESQDPYNQDHTPKMQSQIFRKTYIICLVELSITNYSVSVFNIHCQVYMKSKQTVSSFHPVTVTTEVWRNLKCKSENKNFFSTYYTISKTSIPHIIFMTIEVISGTRVWRDFQFSGRLKWLVELVSEETSHFCQNRK